MAECPQRYFIFRADLQSIQARAMVKALQEGQQHMLQERADQVGSYRWGLFTTSRSPPLMLSNCSFIG